MRRKPSYEEIRERLRELEEQNAALVKALQLQGKYVSHLEAFDAEQARRKSEKHFRDLIENMPIGIAIILDEKVVYRNPEQQRIFGRLPDGDFPSLYDPTTHPDDIETLREYYERSISGEVMYSGMEFRHFPSGDISDRHDMKWIHFRSTPIEYQGRRAVLFTMMDVTKTREMERLLNIQDRMASLGRVAAGIAHEIRNPLSGINLYLNALEKLVEENEPEKMREILSRIQTVSSKIESVIKRVMDFSKPSEPRLVQVDIRKPVEDALGLCSVMLRKSGITVETDLAEGLSPCHADPQLIEQVILNLLTNAAEAMKDQEKERKLEVSTSGQGNDIFITVSDTGPGIPPSQRQKIFDPFYTTKTGSTGIGLSLSSRIVEDHGGSLNVSDSSSGGASFTIRIPIRKEIKKDPT